MNDDEFEADSSVMRREEEGPSDRHGTPSAGTGESASSETGGQTTITLANQVAERVYQLFCRDLEIERERRGRFRTH